MRFALLAIALCLVGCATNLTDEAAITMARTRESTIRASERLAETAERLLRTLDETNAGLARVMSATSATIAELGALLEEARVDARDTRDERQRILLDVSAITSSLNGLLARAEASSRAFDERSRDLARQEARAAEAIAAMTEASARFGESVARLSSRVEPDVAQSSRSVAAILNDVARVTDRLASEPPAVNRWEMVVGAVGGAAVILMLVGLRVAFARAVDAAVRRRLRDHQD